MEPWNGEQRSLVDQWLAALDDSHWNTRATAVRMLGELGELTPLEPLLAALDDEDESVRAATVRALGKLGERAPVDRLVIALSDPSWMVREMAALTLGELDERVPTGPLVDILHAAHEDTFVREAAQLALQQSHPEILPSLAQDTAITRQAQDQSPARTDRHHLVKSSQARLIGLAKHFFPLHTAMQEADDLVEISDDLGTAANSSLPLQPPVSASSRRSLPLRIAEGLLVTLLILGIGVSWLLLAQKLHPSPSGPTSHVGSTPTPMPVVSSYSGDNDMSLTVVNNVVYAGAYGGAVSAVRENDGGLLWQYSTDGSVETSPIVVNGVVYVTAYVSYGPSHMYALRASNGKLLWSYTRNSPLFIPLVVDGVAYLTSDDGLLAALRASDGSVLWHREMKGQGVGIAEIVNGVIYGATYRNQGPGNVDAWRASDGSLLWQSGARLALLDVINGVVYAGLDNDVEALQANTGAMLWRTTLDGYPGQTPIIGSNGVLYMTATVNSSSGTATVPAHSGGYALKTFTSATVKKTVPEKQFTSSVYALRATDGAVLWHYKGKETNGLPTGFIVSDGTVFGCSIVDTGVLPNGVHVTIGYVYALQSSTGVLLWSFILPHNQAIAITVAHSVIYVGSDDAIYALRASTGSLLWRSPLDAAGFVNTPVVDGGSVYIGANNGIVYALQATTGVLRWSYLTKVS